MRVASSLWQAAREGVFWCGLTLELSRPLRRDAGPARLMIDMQGLAGPVARRSGSALERLVRPRPQDCRRTGLGNLTDGCGGKGWAENLGRWQVRAAERCAELLAAAAQLTD
jgi:hypothetical protein